MIDPSAFIAPGAIVLGDVHLGVESSVWYNAVLRGDTDRITIGDRTNIQDLTMIHADPGVPCTVGSRVTVGHRVILHGCTIEDDCLIGMGAIILNRVRVGRGSIVGAGAVLLEGMEVPPGSLVVGLPAKVVRPVDEAAVKHLEHGWRHYIEQARRHREGAFPTQPPSSRGEGSDLVKESN
jgi:carbonic anhydrase/acetyltransferase-like protein (isoleucine patch superfamily)